MGVYIKAINPKNKDNDNFGRSWWGWRPLWYFICELMGILDQYNEEFKYGCCNDGKGFKGSRHQNMINAIKEFRDQHLDHLPNLIEKGLERLREADILIEDHRFDLEDLDEWYDFAINCEGFEVW